MLICPLLRSWGGGLKPCGAVTQKCSGHCVSSGWRGRGIPTTGVASETEWDLLLFLLEQQTSTSFPGPEIHANVVPDMCAQCADYMQSPELGAGIQGAEKKRSPPSGRKDRHMLTDDPTNRQQGDRDSGRMMRSQRSASKESVTLVCKTNTRSNADEGLRGSEHRWRWKARQF